MENKEIQQFVHAARMDNAGSFDAIEKNAFSSMISGMQSKLRGRQLKDLNNEQIKKQIASLDRMESFLDRLTFKNCVFHFQAKTILSQDRRIILLEQEKKDLISRSTSKINEIQKRNNELEKELSNIKKRIKNDKESI